MKDPTNSEKATSVPHNEHPACAPDQTLISNPPTFLMRQVFPANFTDEEIELPRNLEKCHNHNSSKTEGAEVQNELCLPEH